MAANYRLIAVQVGDALLNPDSAQPGRYAISDRQQKSPAQNPLMRAACNSGMMKDLLFVFGLDISPDPNFDLL